MAAAMAEHTDELAAGNRLAQQQLRNIDQAGALNASSFDSTFFRSTPTAIAEDPCRSEGT